jgi:electron transfer flavoprotein alpha subunit
MGNIFVLVDHQNGKIHDITYEMLGAGSEIANALGFELSAILLGHNVKNLASSLGIASKVLYMDHADLKEVTPEVYTNALIHIFNEKPPDIILVSGTNLTMGVGSHLSYKMNLPFINYCKKLKVEGEKLFATCVLYGGKMEAEVSPNGNQGIVGIASGEFPSDKGISDGTPTIEVISPLDFNSLKVKFKQYIEPEIGDVDITQHDYLVAIGRGIQNENNIPLAEELSNILGGTICATRPIVDQGWLPLTRQVGKSGMIVKPKLFLVAGISGAPEHVEGMKNSKLIISINTDEKAPIFNFSHYGVVGDALELLPLLTEKIRAKKGE